MQAQKGATMMNPPHHDKVTFQTPGDQKYRVMAAQFQSDADAIFNQARNSTGLANRKRVTDATVVQAGVSKRSKRKLNGKRNGRNGETRNRSEIRNTRSMFYKGQPYKGHT